VCSGESVSVCVFWGLVGDCFEIFLGFFLSLIL